MTYQNMWRRAYAGAKVAAVGAVVAGVMALSAPVSAATYESLQQNQDPTGLVVFGSWSVGYTADIKHDWTKAYTGSREIDWTYELTAVGNSSTINVVFPVREDPTSGPKRGIEFLTLDWGTWDSSTSTFSSIRKEVVTDEHGVGSPLEFAVALLDDTTYRLNVTGTLLSEGGEYAIELTAVPLPPALVLFLTGLAGIGFVGRVKTKRRERALAAA